MVRSTESSAVEPNLQLLSWIPIKSLSHLFLSHAFFSTVTVLKQDSEDSGAATSDQPLRKDGNRKLKQQFNANGYLYIYIQSMIFYMLYIQHNIFCMHIRIHTCHNTYYMCFV